jgi:RNA polymerase sigma-70 factor (ECF subfamily)
LESVTGEKQGSCMAQLTGQLLAELLDRHGAALKLYARQWHHAPDDVVQQAFIDLAGCKELPANPAAWLFAAVRRRAISQARSERRRQRREEAAAEFWFQRARQQRATADIASEVLAELSLSDREIVIAHLWGRLTFEEIAKLVGTSHSTAQRQFEAAINRLRKRLAQSSDAPKLQTPVTPCPNQKT